MSEARFKKGDVIHFMEDNTPKSKQVLGIARYEGEIQDLSNKKSVPEGSYMFEYHVGSYTTVREEKAFASVEALQAHLFGVIKNATSN